jgi:hypothetical protein
VSLFFSNRASRIKEYISLKKIKDCVYIRTRERKRVVYLETGDIKTGDTKEHLRIGTLIIFQSTVL